MALSPMGRRQAQIVALKQKAQGNPFRNFQLPGNGGRPVMPGQGGGYQGVQGIFDLLNGGINQSQMQHLAQGYTGANGAVGGAHGAFSGLSPQAVHFLATSGLLEKQAAQHQAVTGPDGQPLTGDALFKANFLNTLADNNAAAHPTYKLHSGVDSDFLTQALGAFGGPAFAKGYNASGRIPPAFGGGILPHPVRPGGRFPGQGIHRGGPVRLMPLAR